MSERKVLNKYYPPDFDPAKIPRARCPKNRKFAVRLMAPCNMKCLTCNEYVAQGKKFNARKEDVEDLSYLGIRIYRFYIKCPGCLSEISFRTDPESTDYILEAGAHRNFQALKLAEAQALRESKDAEEEIKSNPMLLLENRTQQSQHEMEVLESLEELRDLNQRHSGLDLAKLAQKYEESRKLTEEEEKELERTAALEALGYESVEGHLVKRVSDSTDDICMTTVKKKKYFDNASVNFSSKSDAKEKKNNMKSKMAGLVKVPTSAVKVPTSVVKIPTSVVKVPTPVVKVPASVVKVPTSVEQVPMSVVKVPTTIVEVPKSSQNLTKTGLGLLCTYSDSNSDDD